MNIEIQSISDDTVKLSWDSDNTFSDVSIFYGLSPEQIDRTSPAVTVSKTNVAEISGLESGNRYYFYIAPKAEAGFILAERRVRLEGSVNFRDLGGYKTLDGRRIKWGKIFRSDNLARLSDIDQTKLMNMGIKLVCDFRTSAEIKKMPDKFPGNNSGKYLHLPIIHGEFDNTALFDRIKNGDIEWISTDFMIKGYIKNLEDFSDTWAEVIKRLASFKNIPLVFHCTAGKDRAGTCAALILLLLDVPEQTVIEDYSLSNVFITKVLDKIYTYIKSLGIDPERVAPYFTAPKECIISLIHHINHNYGSAYNYFTKKGKLEHKTISALKKNLLE
ncbi:MAG: tyrosine-protein phosphatase [Deltaproteobacteria bacterium]|nr:tyrosine-protein phosphatase [Deltaproteobacteria bacterium]